MVWDSVLSILQMPSGIPVATVALNGATNAGILAAKILGSSDEEISTKLEIYQLSLKEKSAFYHRRNQKNTRILTINSSLRGVL